MANSFYPKFKQQLCNKQHDLDTDGIRALLLASTVYTYDAAHDFLDDIPSYVSMSPDLTSPTIALGVFDTADFSWLAVTGVAVDQIALVNYGMGGSNAARGLIAFYDASITGLPLTPNGGDVNAAVHSSGWFAL